MITIEVDDKSWDIPSNINEMTLGNYLDIINTKAENGVDFLKEVYNVPKTHIRKIPKDNLDEFMAIYAGIIADINIADDHIQDILDNWDEKGFETVEIDGKEYEVPQDLSVQPYGKWEDCNVFMDRLQDKEHDFYPIMIAIWLSDFDGSDEALDHFKKCDLYTALILVNFFLFSGNEFLKSFSHYFPQSILVKSYSQVLTKLIADGVSYTASQDLQTTDKHSSDSLETKEQ